MKNFTELNEKVCACTEALTAKLFEGFTKIVIKFITMSMSFANHCLFIAELH